MLSPIWDVVLMSSVLKKLKVANDKPGIYDRKPWKAWAINPYSTFHCTDLSVRGFVCLGEIGCKNVRLPRLSVYYFDTLIRHGHCARLHRQRLVYIYCRIETSTCHGSCDMDYRMFFFFTVFNKNNRSPVPSRSGRGSILLFYSNFSSMEKGFDFHLPWLLGVVGRLTCTWYLICTKGSGAICCCSDFQQARKYQRTGN